MSDTTMIRNNHHHHKSRTTRCLEVLAILVSVATTFSSSSCCSAAKTADAPIHNKKLRGGGNSQHQQQQRRGLFGREYYGESGFDALTKSHVSIPLEHAPPPETETASSSLLNQPVYFEKQRDEPVTATTTTNPYLRIIGGSNATEPQRNFCMHLRWDVLNEQYLFAGCGGVLVSNCHVLTAAHCSADGRVGLPDGLYCNAYNPFQGNYGRDFHFSQVSRTILHADFDNETNENDIALLELEECIEDIAAFPPMKVATEEFLNSLKANDKLKVAGFGRLTEEGTEPQVQHLQSVEVPLVPQEECNQLYPGRVMDDMICAGWAQGGQDACQGDSGGPLFYQGSSSSSSRLSDENQTAVGVVSWGAGCAQPNQPGVYASVAYHRTWIQEHVCADPRTQTDALELCGATNNNNNNDDKDATSLALAEPGSCAAKLANCETTPCCGNLQCKSRTFGAARTCQSPPSGGRESLAGGRGGQGGASRAGLP